MFGSEDFSFAFIVSFVAGAALFGSAFLIPSFAVSVLAFRPTDAGQLLLPSGALFICALLIAAFLMQVRRVPPVATVPFGILAIMAAMWMLSGSTSESGANDMMAAILLRGFGLGFLFLSITLIAFGNLKDRNRASGIGLFNAGRQLGGLMGVAGLQTLIDHNVTANLAVLGASVTAGVPAVSERLTTTTAMLAARGMDAVAASRAATSLLGRAVAGQSTVIAFDTAFNAVALLFVVAAPMLVAIKIGFSRYAQAMTVAPALRTPSDNEYALWDDSRRYSTSSPSEQLAETQGISSNRSAGTAIALAQSPLRSDRSSRCPKSNPTEQKDDLEKHRQPPYDRTGFCALARNV